MAARRRLTRPGVSAGCLLSLALAACGSGCLSDSAVRQGRIAEQRGAYHEAYLHYCRAARDRPSSSGVRSALARVGPPAARYWNDRAREYLRAGQPRAAFRCSLRALLIRPDDTDALTMIRTLEQEHSAQVVSVERAWKRYGQRSLRRDEPAVAAASPDRTGGSHGRTPGALASGRPTSASVQGSPAPPAERGPVFNRRAERDESARGRMDEEAAPAADAEAESSAGHAATEPVAPSSPEPKPRLETRPASGEFLATAIVSREDKRFPKTAALMDDIRVRVLDTDDDPDADMAIYVGRRRVKKVHNWRVGESERVTARSGRKYAIQILSIHDETESVRVGIRRVDTRSVGFR